MLTDYETEKQKRSSLFRFSSIFPFLLILASLGYAAYDYYHDHDSPWYGITMAAFIFVIWFVFFRNKQRDI